MRLEHETELIKNVVKEEVIEEFWISFQDQAVDRVMGDEVFLRRVGSLVECHDGRSLLRFGHPTTTLRSIPPRLAANKAAVERDGEQSCLLAA